MSNITVPPIIGEKYDELFQLVQYESRDGLLLPRQVTDFIHKDVQWLSNTIYEGTCPFAFGNNRNVGRGNSCIHVLPFFAYMTQGTLFRPVTDAPRRETRNL